jgi:hypothetical protein
VYPTLDIRAARRAQARRARLLACALCAAGLHAAAQQPSPSPPPRLNQDELDLQGRASVVQGSGARAFGMGGAFLARADDATAASWNPAGLSYLRRPEFSAVWSHNALSNSEAMLFDVRASVVDRRATSNPDFVAATFPLKLWRATGAAQASYQRVVPFSEERTIERGDVRRIDIRSDGGFDVLALGTGLQVSRRWRLGLAVNRWSNGYTQTTERTALLAGPGSDVVRNDLDFKLSAWNVNLGLIWSPADGVNLGFVAKTPFTADVVMKRRRTDLGVEVQGNDIDLENSFESDDVRLDLPGAVGVGFSWRLQSTLTLSADYTRSFWSAARIRQYFTLPRCPPLVGQCNPVNSTDPGAPQSGLDLFESLRYPLLSDPVQHDTEEIRAGIERVLFLRRVKLVLRTGVFGDRQYFSQRDGSAPRTAGVTFGSGLIVGPILVDAAYVYESAGYPSYDGGALTHVDVRSHRVYVSLIYRHP